MKTFFISIIIALAALGTFTACERNDYQHPLHRK